jgi:hypothetical protein
MNENAYNESQDRTISPDEVAVIRAAIEKVATSVGVRELATTLAGLRVVSRCTCGCDSVDFEEHDPARPSHVIADGIGTTPAGITVGVMVWGDTAA